MLALQGQCIPDIAQGISKHRAVCVPARYMPDQQQWLQLCYAVQGCRKAAGGPVIVVW
jgi:hypothetical protein